MADIKELAISYWRMDKWLNNANVERKMAASSALRSIKKYLDSNGIEVLDLTDQKFDSGLAVDVINNDIPEGTQEDCALISEMIKPIIMQNGSVIQFGQVSIGLTVKKPVENNPAKTETPADSKGVDSSKFTEELAKLKDYIKSRPSRKTKAVLAIGSALLVLVVLLNTVLLFAFKNNLSKEIKNNTMQINECIQQNTENIPEPDLDALNDTLDEIKKSVATNSEKIDSLIKQYNAKVENEVHLQKYTVQKGDNLYNICVQHGIDYNQNINIITSLNGLENPNLIRIGQILILPITETEEN